MHGMVVIPLKSSRLSIRIVVVLVLSWLRDVLRPSVESRSRIGAVQVDGVFMRGIVDEADDGLSPPRDHNGRPGGHAIITCQSCWSKIRVYRFCKGFDFHLVVPDVFTSHGVLEDPKNL